MLTGDVTEPNDEFNLVFSSLNPTECDVEIPTVSEWGLVALTLLVLTAGTIVLRRRAAGGVMDGSPKDGCSSIVRL